MNNIWPSCLWFRVSSVLTDLFCPAAGPGFNTDRFISHKAPAVFGYFLGSVLQQQLSSREQNGSGGSLFALPGEALQRFCFQERSSRFDRCENEAGRLLMDQRCREGPLWFERCQADSHPIRTPQTGNFLQVISYSLQITWLNLQSNLSERVTLLYYESCAAAVRLCRVNLRFLSQFESRREVSALLKCPPAKRSGCFWSHARMNPRTTCCV